MQSTILKDHIKNTFSLAIPIVIGQLGHIMMGVIDNAMVGRVSPVHLAASSIANGFFFIIMVLGIGISYAVAPLVSIANGAQEKSQCSGILHISFYINSITGILLSAMVYFGSPLIHLLGQVPEVTELAIPYTKIIALSTLPMMLFQTYRQFCEGLGIMRPAMFISVFANIIHAAVNYVLIYGKLGFPAMELNGAGWATLLSRTLMAAAIILFVYKHRRFREYDLSLWPFRPNSVLTKKILTMGIGSGFQYFFEVACFVFAAVMVGWIGAKELAAHQIALNVASITYMVVLGISAAAAIRVGNYYGSGDKANARLAGIISFTLSVAFMICSGIGMIVLRHWLPSLYVHDIFVENIAASLFIIAALFQIFDGTQAVGLGALRGLEDTTFPTAITFIAYWVIAIPLGYFLGFTLHWGIQGIWIGLLIGLIASASMLTTRFLYKSKF